jgi:hypothetical protein
LRFKSPRNFIQTQVQIPGEIGGDIIPPKKGGGVMFDHAAACWCWDAAGRPAKPGGAACLQLINNGNVPKQFLIVKGIAPPPIAVAVGDAAIARTLNQKELE